MQRINLESFDSTRLSCCLWDEVKNPKAVVQISHGMSEHIGRYDRFARHLNAHGFIVFGDDHRGHGLTENDKERGNHKGDMFADTVKDLVFINNYLKNKYKLPVLFFGHSYGSFLGQAFLEQDTGVAGVALAGTAYMPRIMMAAGIALLFPIWLILKNVKPKFINKMPDVLTRKRFNETGDAIWITKDEEIRKEFRKDPLSNVSMSINFLFCMLKGIFNTWKRKNVVKLKKNIPIGIFCGDSDIVGMYGKQVTVLRDKYKKLGVKYVEAHLYESDRHEVINETDYEKVFADLTCFFDSCL
ncbi:MAG TPA: alpha/beta fold hydrolase [Clostridia bacterium]|mgnify:CR=1 FL=1|nr:alpha/beta fold hydrolase [Clostridia bacterium]